MNKSLFLPLLIISSSAFAAQRLAPAARTLAIRSARTAIPRAACQTFLTRGLTTKADSENSHDVKDLVHEQKKENLLQKIDVAKENAERASDRTMLPVGIGAILVGITAPEYFSDAIPTCIACIAYGAAGAIFNEMALKNPLKELKTLENEFKELESLD